MVAPFPTISQMMTNATFSKVGQHEGLRPDHLVPIQNSFQIFKPMLKFSRLKSTFGSIIP